MEIGFALGEAKASLMTGDSNKLASINFLSGTERVRDYECEFAVHTSMARNNT